MERQGKKLNRGEFVGAAAAGAVGLGIGAAGGTLIGRSTADDAGSSGAAATKGGEIRTVRIGSPIPLTSASSGDGEQMKNGFELAIEELNAQSAVTGLKIEHTVVDTEIYTPDGIQSGFNRVINEKVDAIALGYVGIVEPANDLAAAYGAPYLHANTQEVGVEAVRNDPDKYGMIFQVDPSEIWYGRNFIRVLNELADAGQWKPPARSLFVIEGDYPYSQTISKAAQDAARESGWDVVGVEVVSSPVTDWRPVLRKIRGAKAAAVMNTYQLPPEVAAFAKQFVADPVDALVYLQYAPSVPEFMELAGDAANGFFWSTPSGTYNDDVANTFRAKYEEKFGAAPGLSIAGICYDQVHILARAWQSVRDPRDFPAVVAAIRGMIHRGVNGGYYLNNDGQRGLVYPVETLDPSLGQAHLHFQIQNGQHKVVWPPPFVDGEYERAPWQRA